MLIHNVIAICIHVFILFSYFFFKILNVLQEKKYRVTVIEIEIRANSFVSYSNSQLHNMQNVYHEKEPMSA